TKFLTPGLFIRVQVPIGEPHQAVVIPERALGTDQGQKFVYVINDKSEAIYRPVTVGARQKQFRVVLKGVQEGERIVVSGLPRVRSGAKVEPKEDKDKGQDSPAKNGKAAG